VESVNAAGEDEVREAAAWNAEALLKFALAIIGGARQVDVPKTTTPSPTLKVGVHSGSCMSGIVGTKNLRFCLFGDAMNTAARMEQTGSAECIHATQDFVDLVPGHDWEKLKKMEVKGKGQMQTYLLRVAAAGGDDSCKTEDSFIADILLSSGCMDPFSPQQDESISSALQSARLVEIQSCAPGEEKEGHSVRDDHLPIKKHVFKKHTKWGGLAFKKLEWEKAYMNTVARSVEYAVYLGYALYLLVLLSNYLFGYVAYTYQNAICQGKDSVSQMFCLANFGQGAFEFAQDPTHNYVSYNDVINFSLFRMTVPCAVVMLFLNFLGPFVHFLIHRVFKGLHNKAWSILNTWCIYMLKMISIVAFVMFGRLSDEESAQWASSVGSVIITQSVLFVFFSGTPFIGYLIWWLTSYVMYFATTIPAILTDQELLKQDDSSFTPFIATQDYIQYSFMMMWFSIILLVGKYFIEYNSRRRFLQRILMLQQQNQIIEEKGKAERMQRSFLESILPPALVQELKDLSEERGQENIGNVESLKRSRQRLRSLSNTHRGASLLYADLVGFTAFSAQVDPFKVMTFLNELFQVFDSLCDKWKVYKIETVGDCYVASVGIVTGELVSTRGGSAMWDSEEESEEESQALLSKENSLKSAAALNARDLLGFAKAMVRGSRRIRKPGLNTPATMRIGIHSGYCISGIVGTRNLKYCLLGDCVETAADMEKTGVPDCIHASEDMADLLPEEAWEKGKALDRKDRGSIQTFLLQV